MDAKKPSVRLETSMGGITVELDAAAAPGTVANFLEYVGAGFYNGTIFHRVIPGFMIQGGGMDVAMREKATRAPIRNEAGNGLKNARGTLAMARTSDVHSASAQFYVNLVDNDFLDHAGDDPAHFGYAVFGRVTDGMETVDAIARVATRKAGPHEDVPAKPVVITKAQVVGP